MRLYLSSFRLGNRPEELLKLLDGRTRTAVITNADDYKGPQERAESVQRELDDLRDIGLDPEELDLRSYFSSSDDFAADIAEFDLIWVRGGSAFILRRALRQSNADEVLRERVTSDSVVYGGYSAGAAMVTPSLRHFEGVDDPELVPPGYRPDVIWDCLGILPYVVLPHYRSDHPESPAIEEVKEVLIDSHIPFIALRDGEAIVIRGANREVAG